MGVKTFWWTLTTRRLIWQTELGSRWAKVRSYENGLNAADYKDRRIKIDDLRVRLANLMEKTMWSRCFVHTRSAWR